MKKETQQNAIELFKTMMSFFENITFDDKLDDKGYILAIYQREKFDILIYLDFDGGVMNGAVNTNFRRKNGEVEFYSHNYFGETLDSVETAIRTEIDHALYMNDEFFEKKEKELNEKEKRRQEVQQLTERLVNSTGLTITNELSPRLLLPDNYLTEEIVALLEKNFKRELA